MHIRCLEHPLFIVFLALDLRVVDVLDQSLQLEVHAD